MQTKTIMISCGEASGDLHCASALLALQTHNNFELNHFGMGGFHLRALGCELLVDIESTSVMGFVEVVRQYPTLRANFKRMTAALRQRRPDLLLLVDYPGFNMRLAAVAQKLKIPVLYFIAPKIWASRPKRISALQQNVNHMAVILPFETALYQRAGIPVSYVGNPVLDNRALTTAAENTCPKPAILQIALLPGSRLSEINQLLPTMLAAAAKLKHVHQSIQFVLPLASTIPRPIVEQHLAHCNLTVSIIPHDQYDLLAQSTAAIAASGTVTLELAVLNVPMVVVYRLHRLSYAIARRILLIEHVSLVNIVAQQQVAVELIQKNLTVEKLYDETDRLISDTRYQNEVKTQFAQLRESLGTSGAAAKLASLIDRQLSG